MVKVLILAPWHDVATTFTYVLANRIEKKLKEKGYDVDRLDLYGVNKICFNIAELEPFEYVIYLGHGLPSAWYGQHPFFEVGLAPLYVTDVPILENQKVVAIACYTLIQLGARAKRYADWYIGANDVLYVAFPEREHNYMEDFLVAYESLVITAVEKDPEIAVKACRDIFKRYAELYYDFWKYRGFELADAYYYAAKHNADVIEVVTR